MTGSRSDKPQFERFTYEFAYPALAGSMLYAVIGEGVNLTYWWDISKILIVLLFVMDYWHLYFHLLPAAPTKRKWFIVGIDAAIPLLFAFMLFYFSHENAQATSLSMLVIALLQLAYPSFGVSRVVIYRISKCVLVVIAGAFAVAFFGVMAGGPSIAVWLAACTVWAVVHTYAITPYCRPNTSM